MNHSPEVTERSWKNSAGVIYACRPIRRRSALALAVVVAVGLAACMPNPDGRARAARAAHGVSGGELWLRRRAEGGALSDLRAYASYLSLFEPEVFPGKRALYLQELGVQNCLESAGDHEGRAYLLGTLEVLQDPKYDRLRFCLPVRGDAQSWNRCAASEVLPACPFKRR